MVQSIDEVRRQQRGRVPPHNLEAEESLLGAMLLSRDAISAATEARVEQSDFYKPAHSHIYDAVMALYSVGEPVDPVTVADELRRADLLDLVGGRSALLRLQAETPASANAAHYAKIVNELALLRRLIGVAGDIAEMGYDDSGEVTETLDRAESMVFEVAERRVSDSMIGVSDALQHTLDQLEQIYGQTERITGVPTGYTDLDDLLLGLQPSTLVVLAARPAAGKTAFALGAAANVAIEARRPVIFFSMEMGTLELTKRLLAAEARVDARKLQTGQINEAEWTRLSHGVGRLAEAPLFIDDNPHCTVMEMRAKARRMKARHGDIGLIVVDYLQLMQPSTTRRSENRQVEVAEISRGLKILARELECPVVALSQLNRQLEYRADKRPMLADLRESGSLEQDADVVIFLYRDEIYNPESDQRGTAEVIVAKHRNGPTGMTRLAFLDHLTKFANMARDRSERAPGRRRRNRRSERARERASSAWAGGDRHAVEALEELAPSAPGAVDVDRVVAHRAEELAEQRAAHLHRDVLADALVLAVAEQQRALAVAVDVEHVGARELTLVSVRGAPEEEHTLPGSQVLSPDLDVATHHPAQHVGGVVVAHGLREHGTREAGVGEGLRLLVRGPVEVVERGGGGELDGLGAGDEERVQLGRDLGVVEGCVVDAGPEQLAEQADRRRGVVAGRGDQAVEIAEHLTHRVGVGRGGTPLPGLAGDGRVQQAAHGVDVVVGDAGLRGREPGAHRARVGVEGVELAGLEEGRERGAGHGAQRRGVVEGRLTGVRRGEHPAPVAVLGWVELGEREVQRGLAEQDLVGSLAPVHRERLGVGARLPDVVEAGQRPGVVLGEGVDGVLGAQPRVEALWLEHRLLGVRVVRDRHGRT